MAAAKLRVSDIARKMGKSEKDVIFQLQSLGAEITDPSQVLEPEVIQALITGKKLRLDRPPAVVSARPRVVVEKAPQSIDSRPVEPSPPPRDVEITCDRCGSHALVPFKPLPGKPVYCRGCYNKLRRKGASAKEGGGGSTEGLESQAAKQNDVSQEAAAEFDDGQLIAVLRQFLRAQRRAAAGDVFVVHGHDSVKHAISHFVSLLGLRPIMLDDRPNRGRTIIEKLEDHSNTSFAIILLTPDDVGAKKGGDIFNPRARQNVILELGYFLAKLGRERVCALYVPGVELPSDIHGLLYVELDTAGAWKYQLQKELVDARLPVKTDTDNTQAS